MTTKYVAYYRVSTSKQEKSGLGLAAQQRLVRDFVQSRGHLIGEFVEVKSGSRNDRVELRCAIDLAKRCHARLVIARLDRFSRRVSFIAKVLDERVGLTVAEMPEATEFQLHIFAALAQEERRLISERTRAALAEARKRGVKLGQFAKVLAERNRQKAQLAKQEEAQLIGGQWAGFSNYRQSKLRRAMKQDL